LTCTSGPESMHAPQRICETLKASSLAFCTRTT
jgi:hypothetical protein